MDWYFLTFLSFGFYVVQGLVMKHIARIGCDRNLATLYYSITVSLCSLPVFVLRGAPALSWLGLVAAMVNGVSYALSSINRLAALKDLPVSIVYPVMRVNTAIVVVLLVLFMAETLSFYNIVGVVLAILSVYFITQGDGN